MTIKICEAKGWLSQSLINQTLLKKPAFGSGPNQGTFALGVIHVRGEEQGPSLRGHRAVWKAVGPQKKSRWGPISKHLGRCVLFRASCKLAPWAAYFKT